MHEHPDGATSWKLPEMQELLNHADVIRTKGHMCAHGMKSKDEKGEGKVQEYIKAEIDRNMIKYQAVGLALMVVAVFGIILCGYLLGCISHKAPSWLR